MLLWLLLVFFDTSLSLLYQFIITNTIHAQAFLPYFVSTFVVFGLWIATCIIYVDYCEETELGERPDRIRGWRLFFVPMLMCWMADKSLSITVFCFITGFSMLTFISNGADYYSSSFNALLTVGTMLLSSSIYGIFPYIFGLKKRKHWWQIGLYPVASVITSHHQVTKFVLYLKRRFPPPRLE